MASATKQEVFRYEEERDRIVMRTCHGSECGLASHPFTILSFGERFITGKAGKDANKVLCKASIWHGLQGQGAFISIENAFLLEATGEITKLRDEVFQDLDGNFVRFAA
ncbi:hypothetical protein M513_08976 [Trichuris suis]|uniref:Uncharacterized protein n=1 Tax=Trichuris suis TaxID=68888 RepID=A0A085LYU1_9BILA|nr:hypothetical protein M513_08976 [Trichuris suis]